MKNKTLLAIDIGNTTITFAILKDKHVKKIWSVETSLNVSLLKRSAKRLLNKIGKKYSLNDVIICSVVPRLLKIIKVCICKHINVKPLIVGENIKIPIVNRYRKPRQVGQDRLVCTYAAKMLYGSPCVVVDFGTAITFDVVSRNGEYKGGIIVPGIRLSAESLFKKAAMLPNVKIARPKSLIGKDTTNSILSGIFYGYGALCDGLIIKLSKKIKGKPTVVATGGHTKLMKNFVSKISNVDSDLVFKGMDLIYSRYYPG